MDWMRWLIYIICGFFVGGIMFSYHVPRVLRGVDICKESDDGNPGAANAFMRCGWKIGLLCVLLDLLKGFLPVFAACRRLGTEHFLLAAAMAAPVAGHAAAPFQPVSGGKCISTAFGVMAATFPFSNAGWVLAGLYILFSTLIRLKPMWLRSIVVFGLFGMISAAIAVYEQAYWIGAGCMLISCIVIARHLRSIKNDFEHFEHNKGDMEHDRQIDERTLADIWAEQSVEHD